MRQRAERRHERIGRKPSDARFGRPRQTGRGAVCGTGRIRSAIACASRPTPPIVCDVRRLWSLTPSTSSPRNRGDAAAVNDLALRVEDGDVQPRVLAPSVALDDRRYASRSQVERWRHTRANPHAGNLLGRRDLCRIRSNTLSQ